MALPAPEERYESFRVLLVGAREWAGLTQIEMGERPRRPQSFVSKIERGLRDVDVIEFIERAEPWDWPTRSRARAAKNKYRQSHKYPRRHFGMV